MNPETYFADTRMTRADLIRALDLVTISPNEIRDQHLAEYGNSVSITPNRRTFQTFFGELHERYGHNVLKRIADRQAKAKRKIRLMPEQDYAVSAGSNPDGLLLETIGNRNTRATLLEFKVGRPRYMDSIIEGDIQEFQADLGRKIADGLDQEISFCRQLLSGQRTIPDL